MEINVENLDLKSEEEKNTSDDKIVVSNKMSHAIILKNLFIVSFACMLQFSAYHSFANLQSTLNKEDGLGTTGLALLFGVMVLTSLFLAPISMGRISTKWIMTWSMCTYIIYTATGFYPTWYTVIPASVIIGIGAAHFWLAMPAYVIDIAKGYAQITGTVDQDRVTFFFGIVFAAIYTSNIWGNLFSSMVFRQDSTNETLESKDIHCGPSYCPFRKYNISAIVPPSQTQVYTFTGFCSGITAFAILLMIVFLTNISTDSGKSHSACRQSRMVATHMFRSRDQQLLFCSSIFSGLASGFLIGDFTSAYISCPYGIQNVGFVMITLGVSQSIFSVVYGKINQYIGHIAIFTFGSVAQASFYITLLLWHPLPNQSFIVHVLAAIAGISGAAIEPVITALHNLYFVENRDIALSSFRLLNSIGWAISFGYSNWLCSNVKMYILIGVLLTSLATNSNLSRCET
ncbi:protein unc-93 homolog A-like isoform X1 [Ruditapes philippinarum]|uniref:protein unc-93 homolog A-like isoform X1 n=1 Tax=Ruditapes philippinarum TaxID=129788 RepID=UPI00295B2DB3|nr:protein unc-93 homolog A-like isoform X1 [Ruditapes philippinarum]